MIWHKTSARVWRTKSWTFGQENGKVYNLIQDKEKDYQQLKDRNIYKSQSVSWAENQHIRIISEGSCDTQE